MFFFCKISFLEATGLVSDVPHHVCEWANVQSSYATFSLSRQSPVIKVVQLKPEPGHRNC